MSQTPTEPSTDGDPSTGGPEFFAVGFGQFQNFPAIDVAPEIERIAGHFAAFGIRQAADWDVPLGDRDGAAAQERLDAWVDSAAPGTILYWVGHGISNQLNSGLVHAASPTDAGEQSKLVTPAALAQAITTRDRDMAHRDHWALVLVDACKSSRFIEQVSQELDMRGGPRRVLLLASSPPTAAATLGQLGAAIASVVESLVTVAEVDLIRLATEIKRALAPIGAWSVKNVEHVVLANRRALPEGLQATADEARRLSAAVAELPSDQRRTSVSTLPDAAEPLRFDVVATPHFTGRQAELATINAWLATTDSMLVVTGAPGSGKSALLGRTLLRHHPLFADAAPGAPTGAAPAAGAVPVDAAVRLTGATVDATIAALARRLGVGEPPTNVDTEGRTSWLLGALGGRRPIVLLDGLDEAADVTGVSALIRRLTDAGRARALIGSRTSADAHWGRPGAPGDDILQRLGAADLLVVERDPEAIVGYVRAVLHAGIAEEAWNDGLENSATRLSVAPDFLFAHLAAIELIARPELATSGWLDDVLARGVPALFRQALTRLSDVEPRHAVLLHALAERRGRGLPIEGGVWLAIADRIAEGAEVSVADLSNVLRDAAPYVMVDSEFGRTAYRLAHRIFEDEMLGRPS